MKMSETIVELAAALAKAQGMIDDATKDGVNPAFRSKYADLAAYRSVIREPLAVNDLAIVQLPRTRQGYVEVETVLMHKSGEFISETLDIPVAKFDAHGIGSGITYGRRYGLMSILCLAAVDDDGNAAVETAPVRADNASPAMIESARAVAISAKKEAEKGMEALNAFWRDLSNDKRKTLMPDVIKDLKAIATKVDEAKGGA
jgi:hypothetical protein